jgi:pyruvate formate lyase activating enzyme
MNIRGIDKFSLIDYPGKIACIIFIGGCNFRCPYCHNPHLVLAPSTQPRISENSFLKFLDSRKNKIDGVVISGGEPTLRKDLPQFAVKIKERGFLVKLDTNGSNPEKAAEMIEKQCVDAFGIDYKGTIENYPELTGSDNDIREKVAETIRACAASGLFLEIRTTVHKRYLSFEKLEQMRLELDNLGVQDWILQQFHPAELIDQSLNEEDTYSDSELANFAKNLRKTRVRGIKGHFIES